MTLNQALTLANLLITWELESPAVQPPPPEWETELKAAKETINQAINRPPAGDYFLSSPNRQRSGRKSNQVRV